ncbi:MAG TPA: cytochrome c3 family protein [Pyrinomonadaceae bacterium]
MKVKLLIGLGIILGCLAVVLASSTSLLTALQTQNSNSQTNKNANVNANVKTNTNAATNMNAGPNMNAATNMNTAATPNTATNTNTAANTNAATNMNMAANTNTAATNTAATNTNTAATAGDIIRKPVPAGVDPLHAVDLNGKTIPIEGVWEPNDKPIILAKDSKKKKADSGELKPTAAFDHLKHSTLAIYGADGKTVPTCVECHHTDQPSAPPGLEYLKLFERKAVLTSKQLKDSNEPVKSCRACHFQALFRTADRQTSPASVTYPPAMKREPSGRLDNETAYHLNCNTCHEAARARTPPSTKAPGTKECAVCHTP